jgi:hypothetical protein
MPDTGTYSSELYMQNIIINMYKTSPYTSHNQLINSIDPKSNRMHSQNNNNINENENCLQLI